MPTLHLGVVDIPYASRATRRRKGKVAAGTQTTGDVAGWLEGSYKVMGTFFDQRQAQIATALEKSIAGALENLLLGAPRGPSPFVEAESKIDDMFRTFLDAGVMEKLGIPGIPTQAALDRKSGRKRSSRFKRRRPGTGVSFIDTGLYQSSFKSWVD